MPLPIKPPLSGKNNFGIICLFPQIIKSLEYGIVGKALEKNHINIKTYDIKSFTDSKKERIDDKPYGGGPGLIIRYEPTYKAIQAAKKDFGENTKVIYLSPQGKLLNQQFVNELCKDYSSLIFLCGRYEGIDARIIENHVDMEISIGDYVLSGGEIPALVIIDAIARQIEGVLGNSSSAISDSLYHEKILEFPQYTRPEIIDGHSVPNVLLSGNHKAIQEWKKKKSIEITKQKRPELLQKNNKNTKS